MFPRGGRGSPCLRQTLRQPYAALRAPLFLHCFWAYAEPYANLTRAYARRVSGKTPFTPNLTLTLRGLTRSTVFGLFGCPLVSAYAEPYAKLTRAYAHLCFGMVGGVLGVLWPSGCGHPL